MAVQGQKKEFALDSNILFDLAVEKDFAHAFREGYQERGYSLRVPPTVIQELTYYAVEKRCAETPLAIKALQQMRHWHLLPFDLKSVGHGITEQFSARLIPKLACGLQNGQWASFNRNDRFHLSRVQNLRRWRASWPSEAGANMSASFHWRGTDSPSSGTLQEAF